MSLPSTTPELDLDLDLRLREVWDTPSMNAIADTELVGPLLRAAYGLGYVHALREPVRGALCLAHGYPVPAREPRRPVDPSRPS